MEGQAAANLTLPEALLDFLDDNGIDSSIYKLNDSIPRYIRLKPGRESLIKEIETEINHELKGVDWLPNFFSLPPDVQIAKTKAYKEGKIYGIDAASGAAVSALSISPGDHILDLCSAPGAKLCMMLDLLGGSGSVTGVDVARHRLAACRTMLLKYGIGDHCRLFVANGTKFSLPPVVRTVHTGEPQVEEPQIVYKEWSLKKRPWKERKRINKAMSLGTSLINLGTENPELMFYGQHSGIVGLTENQLYQAVDDDDLMFYGYDKVLVDAECTHDGSIKHIQKFEQWGWQTFQNRVLDAERTDELSVLQLGLLTNGFRLLKAGGYLIYSTCSLTIAQNEDVVERFLLQNASAKLVEIDASSNWPCRIGYIGKTIRFDPTTSRTSGLFIAKFTKLKIRMQVHLFY
ncbi:uncharacterized protein LOC124920696 [Impatiens glandulifera]|uniref:uncharacterized protein LOC124920696 n=1 Tax=Impatiens glandulifera TaxID=253017 RepID=UPI001FB067D8|nr:uncharacterized protein LOC124920696 [Impatiens glandulifera]